MVASSLLLIAYPALTAQPAGPINNVALAATITASSSNAPYVATNAGDGNQSTYWESANNAFPSGSRRTSAPPSRSTRWC